MTDKRPVEIHDLAKIAYVNDPQLSPDGHWVAFVKRTVDLFKNKNVDNIWLAATNGDTVLQLTRGNSDTTPRWSPDGTQLAFVSKRGDKAQVYLLPVAAPGGEARALTQTLHGASAPSWSPDGKWLAYLTPLNADERKHQDEKEKARDPLEERHRKERQEQDEAESFDPRHVLRIPFRAGTKYLDNRYQQIHIINVDEGGGELIALTNIDADHDPPHWLDKQTIITARSTMPEIDEPYRRKAVFRIDISSKEAQELTGEGYSHHQPKPSPDGSQIALWRYPGSNYSAQPMLAQMQADGSHIRDLNVEIDRPANIYKWQPRSDRLLAAVADSGSVTLHDTLAFDQVYGGTLSVTGFDASITGSFAVSRATSENPSVLIYLQQSGAQPVSLVNPNQELLDEVAIQPTEEIWFEGANGQNIQGWYQLPLGYEVGQQYPMVVFIHGGPHGMWGPGSRSLWHQWQLFSGAGYVVFFCNPHGSSGYSADFRASIHGEWGRVNHIDIMAGVDAMLELAVVDANRLGITGGSYGGYLTAWVIAHTDRFQAAVAQRGVYNLLNFYGTTDIPAFVEDQMGGVPWDIPERLWETSPVAHAHRIKAPLLLLHSENDFRVPIEQAEQMFAFVKRSGGTAELVRYPRDGHELSRSGESKHRIDRLERMLGWFNTYLRD